MKNIPEGLSLGGFKINQQVKYIRKNGVIRFGIINSIKITSGIYTNDKDELSIATDNSLIPQIEYFPETNTFKQFGEKDIIVIESID